MSKKSRQDRVISPLPVSPTLDTPDEIAIEATAQANIPAMAFADPVRVKPIIGESVLDASGVRKTYGSTEVLHGIDFTLYAGERVALIGPNGAGKSTLMKILSGAYSKDEGAIFFKGIERSFASPKEAQEAGIAIIYQELNLIPYLSITENIYLGNELQRGSLPLLNWPKMHAGARDALTPLHLTIDPHTLVMNLGIAAQQMIEIAKALHHRADLIIMDEPTSALSLNEIEDLFTIIGELKACRSCTSATIWMKSSKLAIALPFCAMAVTLVR